MISVDEEAESYAHNWFNMHETNNFKALKQGFMAGVNSKYVQAKIIQAQIKFYEDGFKTSKEDLQQQLKELEI